MRREPLTPEEVEELRRVSAELIAQKLREQKRRYPGFEGSLPGPQPPAPPEDFEGPLKPGTDG